MSSRFRHEDVSAVPSGWKVRTVAHGDHRVRVAFPPGRKSTNPGRLVSILHPLKGHNPCNGVACTLRSTNPAELLVMGANPPRRRNAESKLAREAEKLKSKLLKLADQAEKKGLRGNAAAYREMARKNPAELLVMGANPRVEVVHGDNPPVEDIHEAFTGQEVKWLDVYNEPHMSRGRYAQLGPLLSLHIKPAKGGQAQKIDFGAGDARPLVVTDSTARRIYFVGGNQDISEAVHHFTDSTEPIVALGECRRIDYQCRKEHVASPDEDLWKHNHGEEDGALPMVLFDTRAKRLLYSGGNYRIEGAWIHN